MINFVYKLTGINIKYFIKGGTWLSTTQLVISFLSFLTSVVLANTLTESTFGAYKYMIALAGLIGYLSLTGAPEAIFQAVAKEKVNFLKFATEKGLLYSIPVVICGITIAIYYYSKGDESLALACVAISVFQPLINIFTGITPHLKGSHLYKEASLIQISKSFIASICILVILQFTHEPIWLFIVFICTTALTTLVSYLLFYNKTKYPLPDIDIKKKYLSYSKHVSIRNLIGLMSTRVDSIIVFQLLGAGSLAAYSVASIIPEQIKGSIKNLSLLIIQRFSDIKDESKIVDNVSKNTLKIFFVFSFITIIYCLTANLIYPVIFPKYEQAVLITQILALSIPAHASVIPYSLLKLKHRESALYQIQIIVTCLSLLLLILGTYYYGIIGTAVARVSSRYMHLFLSYFFAIK